MLNKNLRNYLKKAEKEKWAIGQFNVSNLEILRAIILAAQKLKSPVLIGTSEGESKFLGLKQAVALVKSFKKKTKLSLFLNLDHGKTFNYIKKAIEAGYDTVHFDDSGLSLKKNIALTKKVMSFAKKKGVLVEGEVGIIGGELTKPEDAEKFAQETKVDRLAVNVGTVHGKKALIDFKRLKEIKKRVGKTLLVLHGGSGVSKKDIKKAIKLGIVKININTALRIAYTNALKKALRKKPKEITPYKYLPHAIEAVQKVVEEKIKIFGSRNRS